VLNPHRYQKYFEKPHTIARVSLYHWSCLKHTRKPSIFWRQEKNKKKKKKKKKIILRVTFK